MSIVRRGASGSASSLADVTDRPLGGAHVRRGPADAGASAGRCADADDGPLLFTAKQLHIGRTLAYQQAERYLVTNGRDGIPAIKIGNCLRVPRPGVLALAFTGRVVHQTPAIAARIVGGDKTASGAPKQPLRGPTRHKLGRWRRRPRPPLQAHGIPTAPPFEIWLEQ